MRVGCLVVAGFVLAAGLLPVARAEIRVVGSDMLGPRFQAAFEQFAREAGMAVTFDLRGTRPGIEALNTDGADLGLFNLPPGELPPAGAVFVSHAVAFQPVVVLVPRRAAVTQLTHAQLRGLFAVSSVENASTWGDVGLTGEWRARPIAAHAPTSENFLTVSLARRLVFNGADLKPTVLLAPDLAQLTLRLGAGENTIALSPALPPEDGPFRALAVAASVNDAAFLPTPENLASGTYPLRLPLYLTIRRASAERLLPLLRFLLSDPAAEALAEANFQLLPVGARNQLIFELEELR